MLKPIKQLLFLELKNKIPERNLQLLPSSYQKIGDIVIINLKRELWEYDKIIGRVLLEKISNTRSVFRRTGFIKTKFRSPQIKCIAGLSNPITIHKEHGINYKLDVKEIMFSKGNLNERKRIIKQIEKGEIVVDMFAGIGYFCLGIAKFSQAKKIYAIEINPKSYGYLLENIKMNKVENKIIPILGDAALETAKLGKIADRVIMGLLPNCKEYLSYAMKIVRSNGLIHYHMTAKKENKNILKDVEKAAKAVGHEAESIKKIKVKSYAPKIYHWVLDCKII